MSPEAQRIAIAEACGWTRIMAAPGFASDETFPRGVMPGSESMRDFKPLPDFLSDLNAMNEAEKVLRVDQFESYMNRLADACPGYTSSRFGYWPMVCATAAQRAEAFLRCLGKWSE